jgi:hypothetical protein
MQGEPKPAQDVPAPVATNSLPAAQPAHLPTPDSPKPSVEPPAAPPLAVSEAPPEKKKREAKDAKTQAALVTVAGATKTTEAPKVVPESQPEKPHGSCGLDPSQYAAELEQADKSLSRGKYTDAQRQFGAVFECEPGNARAREGLERVKRQRDAEKEN